MTECDEIERTHALADGELSAVEADQARAHLATCAACQAELADLVQLDMAVADREVRAEADGSKTDGKVISLAWYRRRSVQLGGMVLAAAAIALVYIGTRPKGEPGPTTEAPVQIALGPKRLTEARMSWGDAAKHRPYDVPRAGEPPKETIGLATLAEIEKRGDLHGVGVLAMLEGDRTRAASYLERAPESADVLADRAALALGEGAPEKALVLADAALEKQAGHSAATWNRALALRDLGLVRAAAAGFAAIAAKHEPGWSDEATTRGKALDADTDARRDRAANIFGARSTLGAGLTVDHVRALPGLARLVLYDVARAAPADKLAALAPLFDALGPEAVATFARIQKHPELAAGYADLIAGKLQGAAITDYIAAALAAHADEHYIGAAVLAGRGTVDKTQIFQIAAHAAASPDPWFQLIGLEQQAAIALASDDLAGAETVLLRARARCAAGAPSYRCIKVETQLADVYRNWQRLPEARSVLADAWTRARRDGEWFLESALLPTFTNLAMLTDDVAGTGLPLIRAYGEELRVRQLAEGCRLDVWTHMMTAMVLVNQIRFSDAQRELAAAPACDQIGDAGAIAQLMFVRAHIARASNDAKAIDAFVADVDKQRTALRAVPMTPPWVFAVLDHAEGRALIDRDAARAEPLLRAAITAGKAAPREDASAHKAAAWSYAVLAIAAAHRNDANAALALLGEEQGVTVPTSCVLGLALDDQRRIAVARDATGKPLLHYDEDRRTPALDPATLVPADMAKALVACSVVEVIARSPIHGTAHVLPDNIAWRYASPRTAPPAPASAREVVVADVTPPAELGLPRLARWATRSDAIAGPAATPARVLEAIGDAGVATIHAHGLVDLGRPDASFLALSPDAAGRYALTAGTVAAARFRTSPLVILAACRASQSAPVLHEAWSLPVAFIRAGARAVVASASPIPDGDADAFFEIIRTRVTAGVSTAVAVRDARVDWLSRRRGEWVRDVIVFE